jgi:molybdopterin converting factor small subunit
LDRSAFVTSDVTGPANHSRRHLLRLVVVGAAGGGVALLGLGALFGSKSALAVPSQAATPTTTPAAEGATNGLAASVRIKVKYFQMASALPDARKEYYNLRSPATFSQLRADMVDEHPVLAGMLPNMLILVNGVVATADTPLSDGDEVDFIPAIAGG